MKEHILQEIRRLSKETGKTPGQRAFARETGIGEHQWRGKFWARWGDALVEAGFLPNNYNQKLGRDEVLFAVIAACRHYKKIPTMSELTLYGQSNPHRAGKLHQTGRVCVPHQIWQLLQDRQKR